MRRFIRTPLPLLVALAITLAVTAAGVFAGNIDQNSNGSKFAWGENVGWLNARPTAEAYGPAGNGVLVTDTGLKGYLWGENIGWINLSCQNDASCGGAAGSWGVTNDGAGHLSGYAWGENVGWISFSCANKSSCGTVNYGVTITNATTTVPHAQAGVFTGYAWGENIGWISFNCSNDGSCGAVSYQTQTGWPDSDGDGYTDTQETGLGKNPFTYCVIMRADVDGNHIVNLLDLAKVATQFGQNVPPGNGRYDQNADNKLNLLDLAKQATVYAQNVSACP